MKEIVIIIRGKVVRMSSENKALLSQIICANPFAQIIGKKDGKEYQLQLVSNGTKWIEK